MTDVKKVFHQFRQTPQVYVEAIDFTNENVPHIVSKLKEKNIQHRLYTKDMSDDKHKCVYNTVFIIQASSELRLTYGMYLVIYDKGHVCIYTKEDFNRRYEAVGSASNDSTYNKPDPDDPQYTLWGGRKTW